MPTDHEGAFSRAPIARPGHDALAALADDALAFVAADLFDDEGALAVRWFVNVRGTLPVRTLEERVLNAGDLPRTLAGLFHRDTPAVVWIRYRPRCACAAALTVAHEARHAHQYARGRLDWPDVEQDAAGYESMMLPRLAAALPALRECHPAVGARARGRA
jgi:hypothetical protein